MLYIDRIPLQLILQFSFAQSEAI